MDSLLLYRITITIIGIISIIMMIITHFGYQKMYVSMKDRYVDLLKRYQKKCEEFDALKELHKLD